ncbi:hypothetical protein [Bradyrhizobium elkanii]|uniref:hypothetical protein n=1 Tax=Bradyrhizobium elkanii TaxID=29448 RepID=UPI00272CFC9B|nr:hypothetical protein [Bradyrhizobium elkanii]WLA84307.1 hypothetical protein QNJ99_08630 [Bradyrhizobium elkanii]
MHENEYRHDTVVDGSRFGVHLCGIKCHASVFGAARAGMLDVGDIGGLGREFVRRYRRRVRPKLPDPDRNPRHGDGLVDLAEAGLRQAEEDQRIDLRIQGEGQVQGQRHVCHQGNRPGPKASGTSVITVHATIK